MMTGVMQAKVSRDPEKGEIPEDNSLDPATSHDIERIDHGE